jgi:hypothetical protein
MDLQAPGLKANTPSPPPNNGGSWRQGKILQEILFESLFARCVYGSSIDQENVNLQDFIPRQKRRSDKIQGIKCGVGRKDMVKKPLIFDGFIYFLYRTLFTFFYHVHPFANSINWLGCIPKFNSFLLQWATFIDILGKILLKVWLLPPNKSL